MLRSTSSFNTQPRGGGCYSWKIIKNRGNGFNTQPRGGGCYGLALYAVGHSVFQHTAARRRLRILISRIDGSNQVSTHSRAEAAAVYLTFFFDILFCFNTQPRGGGCSHSRRIARHCRCVSTHSRAEAAALPSPSHVTPFICFNTQPRGGGCILRSLVKNDIKTVSTHSRAEAAALCWLSAYFL